MKIRRGFVSNSSSSSFMIDKCDLTSEQIYQIKDHAVYAKLKNWNVMYDCPWCIDETEDQISGSTSMDNFDMRWFLDKINVNMDKVTWER
jgi:hypothetical protein